MTEALWWTLGATFTISLIAWIGIVALFFREDLLDRILLALVALAAGSLMGGAVLHLLPRSIRATGAEDTLPLSLALLTGFCSFYVLEQFLSWHHHHGTTHDHEPVTYLVLISDSIHNFIDGIVIAAAFLASPAVGITTSLAIALHEIPQELGDFGVLVHGGFSRGRALVLNYATQATVILGGILGIAVESYVGGIPAALLPFAAGNFIYIASADLIPEIKHSENLDRSLVYFLIFLLGILMMLGIKFV